MKKTEQNQTKKKHIEIAGQIYAIRPTMGALLNFKRETGREVSEIQQDSLSDVAIFLYCICKAAAKADKQDFPFASAEDFAAHISLEQLNAIDLQF